MLSSPHCLAPLKAAAARRPPWLDGNDHRKGTRGWTDGMLAVGCIVMAVVARAADASAGVNKVSEPDFLAMTLEELGTIKVPTVFGASKHEQKTTEAPSAVSIVTREDIQQFGYRTLGDLLRSVRGFYVTNDRAYNFTGLRGVNRPGDFGGRVLVNIDGHRLNEPVFDSAFTDTDFLLDLDLVDHVEVIRGPGSSLYGNNAFFTVINVVTRRGAEMNGGEAAVAAGSFDTESGRLSYGQKFSRHGVELLFSGTYLHSGGHGTLTYPEFSAINQGRAEGRDGSLAKSAYVSLSFGEFSLTGGYLDRRKNIPTGSFGTIFNNPDYVDRDVRSYAELKYTHTTASSWLVSARGYYDYYRFSGNFPYDYPPVTLNQDHEKAQWVGADVFASKTLAQRHHLTLGTEVREAMQLYLRNADEGSADSYVDSNRREFSFAIYAQDEIVLHRNLTLNAGIRHDQFANFGGTTNPRGALVYQPWQGGSLKFIYGQAFRAPNSYERDYIAPAYKSNPDLQPETIRSYELVFEQSLNGNLRFTGNLYLNKLTRLVGQTLDPKDGLNYFANIDNADVHGFEVELEGRWANGLRGRVSYTYADARDPSTDRILTNSPRHVGKANVAVPLWREKIFAGVELQAMSHRATVQDTTVPGFWLANLTLSSRELVKGLELSASLYNVFDRKYSDPVSPDFAQAAIPQDGRSLRVKLTRKF